MKNLGKLFNEIADTPNFRGLRVLALSILAIALISVFAMAVLNINRQAMVVLGVVLFVTFLLTSFGYIVAGSWTALFFSFFILSSLVFINNGIRDIALMGLIVILVATGLLAGKIGTIICGMFIIVEIIIYRILEAQGVLHNKLGVPNQFSDYFALIIAVSLITAFQWLVINQLNKNVEISEAELEKRLKIQTQLEAAEASYRGLVESIPVAVYTAEPGVAGKWNYVSPRIFTITGYTPEEWMENPHLWFSRVYSEDRERVLEEESKALRAGEMPKLEYRLLTRDNRQVWVYDESLVIVDANKLIVQGFILDITSRKQTEQQLKSRLEELKAVHGISETLIQSSDLQKLIENTGEQIRLAFRANNVLIGVHDPNTDLIHFPYEYEDGVNKKGSPIRYGQGMTTQIMKMKQPLLINTNWNETAEKFNVIHTNTTPILSSFSVPVMSSERVFGVITLESTEHEFAFDEINTSPLLTIASNLAVAIEKTRLQESLKKELEIQERLIRELEMKNEELERFSYSASHDLKSPLITIRGFLGYLENDARKGNFERLRSDIQRISDATEKMYRLLSEILELSRVGRVTSEIETFPFEVVIQEALARVEGRLKEKQVLVRTGSGFPSVFGDKERLIEVVQNLVDNAAKFTSNMREPDIEINYFMHNNLPVFYVRDNGIGIKKEFQERVFGLFDKLDPDSEGTGVGLALVKRIIEVHDGKIWVESSEGAGTTFYFTIGNIH